MSLARPSKPSLDGITAALRQAGALALYDAAGTRECERVTLRDALDTTLLQRAGESATRLAIAMCPNGRHVWVACGPGHNGADGAIAALALKRMGWRVSLTRFGPTDHQRGLLAKVWSEVESAGLDQTSAGFPFATTLAPPDVAIDAVLGLGGRASAAHSNWPMEAVAALNQARKSAGSRILSLDLPTGLNADTGSVLAGWQPEQVVHADCTLTFLTAKAGLFTGIGRQVSGDVWVAPLGVTATAPPVAWLTGRPTRLVREHGQHKGSFGDVACVGGAEGMVGAVRLAGRAALACGAGRVYLASLASFASQFNDLSAPELMTRRWRELDLGGTTVVAGCGGGQQIADVLPDIIRQSARLVLDADALNQIAANPPLQRALRRRAERLGAASTVLTPHPLEAARLLGSSAAEVQADRLMAARRLARELNAIVVLKGSGTVVCDVSSGELPSINPTGNAALSTAGSGDVLAGMIAALWSQQSIGDAAAAARAAVWWHGHAADQWASRHPGIALAASRLIDELPAAVSLDGRD